jgi:cytochrome c oxidase subunit 5a
VTPRLARASSNTHHQETFESFTERYVNFFQSAEDLFEVQRGLNNCFAHDLVPAPAVVESALRASRRVNDYATAVRVLEGIKEKVENKAQYQAYLDELKPVREELGALFVASLPHAPLSYLVRLVSRYRHKRRLVCFIDPAYLITLSKLSAGQFFFLLPADTVFKSMLCHVDLFINQFQ